MAKASKNSGANVGFEEKLWKAADKLRGHMDPSEYKHVVLGFIFLKYVSDSFEEKQRAIEADPDSYEGESEDKDAYLSHNVFWVPKEGRWSNIQGRAKSPEIGQLIDAAMVAIEKENPRLKGVLPKNYGRPELDKERLGEVIDLISSIGLGDEASRSKDVLGRVYEYFLSSFASAEGFGGGEFYTPQSVVKLLVEMLEPYKGRIFDPACGSGGLFVQSERFVEAHGGKKDDIAVYGQESNPTTWKLCKMNLAIRGLEANLGERNADTFHSDQHKDLKADFVIANPPFNDSDWGGDRLRDDVRWKYGVPPVGNANYAWIQHFIHHLAPTGSAGFVMANGASSSMSGGEGEIRQKLIEAGLIDCIVALPGQLFYSTAIPVTLWFVSRDRQDHKFRDRRDEILFIDTRKMGTMVDRRHRELTDEDIAKISGNYHAWRNVKGKYKDEPGFCRATPVKEVVEHGHVLTPGRFVGTEEVVDEGNFEEKMQKLTEEMAVQFNRSRELEKEISKQLGSIGYEI